jgi:hypothetical protein
MSLESLFGNNGVTPDQVSAMIAAATDPEKIGASLKTHGERKQARVDLHQLLADRMGELRSTSAVVRHIDPANKVSLDKAMSMEDAMRILESEVEAENQIEAFHFPMKCRWEDGAVALPKVLEEIYGASGVGQRHFSFFGGSTPPEKLEIVVGLEKNTRGEVVEITETVPGSEFYFAPLEAKIDWSQNSEGDDTGLFVLRVELKVKNRTSAKYIAQAIEDHVRANSIYKGQILRFEPIGRDKQGKLQYKLQHVWREVDPSIVYSEEAGSALQDEVLGKITGSAFLRNAGMADNFKVLVYGPLGTGKSAFLVKTAVVARDHHRTVIEYNPKNGVDINELLMVNKVAQKYGDTVILIEDIDQFYPVDTYQLSLMTNLFDGVDKTSRVSYLMTTNHLDDVEPEMTRPPRLTGIIEVAQLDRTSIERMFRLTLGDDIAEDVDFDQIWSIVHEFSPSFIRTGFDKAKAKKTQDGRGGEPLTTADLVFAARSLVNQHKVHTEQAALKAERKVDHLTPALAEIFTKVLAQINN